MLDWLAVVSEFDNFDDFSLFDVPVTIERYTGALAAGKYGRTLAETIDTFGSAHPYTTIESQAMFDPPAGVNIEKKILLYTSVEIFMEDNTNANPFADIITVDGRQWKPLSVNNWNFGDLGHYRSVLGLYDGD